MEIQSTAELADWLGAGRPLGGVRLQDLDLGPVEKALLRETRLSGLVVLGGEVSSALLVHLQSHGAVVFPEDPDTPVDVFRAHLYTGSELYAGLDGPGGYAATVDSRAYEWARDMRLADDAYATLLKAIHDDSISDALDEWVEGRRVVGIMGGHQVPRGTGGYTAAARTGHALAAAGLLVATGGGPGAMEAANLGAVAPSADALDEALERLRPVPTFVPDVDAWARVAFEVLESFGPRVTPRAGSPAPAAEAGAPDPQPRSLGVPTWFYGREPPNVFAEGIAKYFSNAVREDGLLVRSNAGVLVMPGEAGTVQEVFQLATRLYYAADGDTRPPLVLVGVDHWVETFPVWPLLRAMARERGEMGRSIHLVDEAEEAVALVAAV
ncbi:MAG TPA: Rossmann fold nucleotide-binding protein [Lapillicoccus sp.]|uniref:Rossmann fold nucleotide-binding protein n=1 Tax=Lapillicoccus sp. TaxID=1909287 RepID=UPI002F92E566